MYKIPFIYDLPRRHINFWSSMSVSYYDKIVEIPVIFTMDTGAYSSCVSDFVFRNLIAKQIGHSDSYRGIPITEYSNAKDFTGKSHPAPKIPVNSISFKETDLIIPRWELDVLTMNTDENHCINLLGMDIFENYNIHINYDGSAPELFSGVLELTLKRSASDIFEVSGSETISKKKSGDSIQWLSRMNTFGK